MSPHMTPEEFRTYGKQVVDWIADYLGSIESYPVASRVGPGEVRAALPAHPPERGEPFENVLADLERVILPGVTHWQHPGFYGYFPSNTSGPGILGELLSAGLGVQGMVWLSSPACTELETVVVDWLAELFGLPEHFRTDSSGGGVIQDSASSANLVAVVAARQRAGAGRHTIYVSSETHSSLEKAARIAGIARDRVRAVDVDPDTLEMRPEHLDALIAEDLAAGAVPTMVCATVGTTSTTAIDPVRRIGEICRARGVWLHVDAAYAGTAAVCPELRWLNDGVAEYADSYATNPHKWLLTNFDCGVLWLADRAPMIDVLSIVPEYLRNAASSSGEVIDYRDWQVPLGRRFRALKLWSVIRWYGAEGLREHIRTGVRLSDEFAALAGADDRFEVREHHPFGLVCVRPLWPGRSVEESNAATMSLLERLNASGEVFLTHTKVGEYVLLRLAIGSPATEPRHVERVWELLRTTQGQLG